MPVLKTRLIVNSDGFRANAEAMRARVEDFRALEAKIVAASSSRKARFEKRGQLLPRDRVARLIDRGSPFLELSTLAGYKMHDDDGGKAIAGGGSIVGIGIVCGKRVMINANDSAIKGGTVAPMGLKKGLRAQAIAAENKLPTISLTESGGANLIYQSELFVEGGRSFANMARMSAAGLPHVCVVHGSSTAGGAYVPGLSDYVVLVRGRSKIFLAGPPLVKAAIGEDANDEDLGGAELHAKVTGLGEYLAEDDAHAIALTRDLFDKLPWDTVSAAQGIHPPLYDSEELLGVVPADEREPYDVREIIARIVDGSDFLDFKPGYCSEIVCGHARIHGISVGIIGNNGPIQPTGSTKAAHFIQLCDQSGTPLIFLQNTTGYMVGSAAERAGSVKHGSKMIQAVANARVPRITIVVGGSYGAGNYGMCGRGFDPRFIFSWPNAKVAVMGGEQIAKVMEIVTRGKFEELGQAIDEAALAQMSAKLKAQIEVESTSLYSTARLWDDGLIDPRDTRPVIAQCLAIALEGDKRQVRPNTFGIARM